MKRILSILLCAVIAASFTACTDDNENNNSNNTNSNTTQASQVSNDAKVLDTDILEWVDFKEYNLDKNAKLKNVILMIGDGMGENTIKASEIVKGDKLVMSGLSTSVMVKTNSLDGTTDSAAASTAISCGVKTHNRYIGVDKDGIEVETLCEFAIAKGMKTGLVLTQVIPHATPAGMIAHSDSRAQLNLILKQMLTANVDVLLGGGGENATKKIQSLAKKNGYEYLSTPEELQNTKADKLLGTFAFANIVAGKTPSLATMTQKALNTLENDDGFFLMVEGSDIDIFAAKLDMKNTLKEMQSFDKSVDVVLKWAEKHPGTLVIVCADHETGGVKIPENATAADINDSCFTSGGEHTSTNIKLMAGGAQSDKLFSEDVIENTEIAKSIRKVLNESYGEKPVKILNESGYVGLGNTIDDAA